MLRINKEEKVPQSDKFYLELIEKELTAWLCNEDRLCWIGDEPTPLQKPSYYMDMILNDPNCLRHLSNIAMALIHFRVYWERDNDFKLFRSVLSDFLLKYPQYAEEFILFIKFEDYKNAYKIVYPKTIYPDWKQDMPDFRENVVHLAVAIAEVLKNAPTPLLLPGGHPNPEIRERLLNAITNVEQRIEQTKQAKQAKETFIMGLHPAELKQPPEQQSSVHKYLRASRPLIKEIFSFLGYQKPRAKTTDDMKNPHSSLNKKRKYGFNTTDDLMDMKNDFKRRKLF